MSHFGTFLDSEIWSRSRRDVANAFSVLETRLRDPIDTDGLPRSYRAFATLRNLHNIFERVTTHEATATVLLDAIRHGDLGISDLKDHEINHVTRTIAFQAIDMEKTANVNRTPKGGVDAGNASAVKVRVAAHVYDADPERVAVLHDRGDPVPDVDALHEERIHLVAAMRDLNIQRREYPWNIFEAARKPGEECIALNHGGVLASRFHDGRTKPHSQVRRPVRLRPTLFALAVRWNRDACIEPLIRYGSGQVENTEDADEAPQYQSDSLYQAITHNSFDVAENLLAWGYNPDRFASDRSGNLPKPLVELVKQTKNASAPTRNWERLAQAFVEAGCTLDEAVLRECSRISASGTDRLLRLREQAMTNRENRLHTDSGNNPTTGSLPF